MSIPSAVTNRHPPRPIGCHTYSFLAGYYFLAVVSGVRGAYILQPSFLDLLVPLGGAFALIVWALVDASRRGHPIPLLSKSWFALGYFVTVPGYVLWTRGWRGLLWLLLHVVLWVITASVTTLVLTVMMYLMR